MRGTYVFKQAGEIVGTGSNLITTAGRREILRFLSGQRGNIGGAIGIGAGTTAPALTDTSLVLEYARSIVELSAPDFTKGVVVYKTTLPQSLVGTIYEVGLWSNGIAKSSDTNLLTFDANSETWTGGTYNGEQSRIGSTGYRLEAGTNASVTGVLNPYVGDVNSVGANDTFVLAFFCHDPNTLNVRVRFTDTAGTNYFEYLITDATPGYNVRRFTKANFTLTGSLTWATVTRATIDVIANATDAALNTELGETRDYTGTRVDFDRLLVVPYVPGGDTGNILVSRSVPALPVRKTALAPMEIEYYLELTA